MAVIGLAWVWLTIYPIYSHGYSRFFQGHRVTSSLEVWSWSHRYLLTSHSSKYGTDWSVHPLCCMYELCALYVTVLKAIHTGGWLTMLAVNMCTELNSHSIAMKEELTSLHSLGRDQNVQSWSWRVKEIPHPPRRHGQREKITSQPLIVPAQRRQERQPTLMRRHWWKGQGMNHIHFWLLYTSCRMNSAVKIWCGTVGV